MAKPRPSTKTLDPHADMTSSAVVEKIWKDFCGRFQIAQTCVPLFAEDSEGSVKTREIGKKPVRLVLQRSDAMESRVVHVPFS